MFRPVEMVWVDLLVDRDSIAAALQVLGQLGVLELQRYDRSQPPFEIERDDRMRNRLLHLQRSLDGVRRHLPAADVEMVEARRRSMPTAVVVAELERSFEHWLSAALPISEDLQQAVSRLEELVVLETCLRNLPEEGLDVQLLSGKSARRFPPFLALGRSDDVDLLTAAGVDAIGRAYPLTKVADDAESADARVLVVGVTDRDKLPELERRFHSRGMRFVRVPADIPRSRSAALSHARGLVAEQRRICARLRGELEALNRRSCIAGELWLLRQHLWLHEVLEDSLVGARFVWLGGWAPASRYRDLVAALQRGGIPFLINREPAREHGVPPVEFDNPPWIRRFERLVTGFGVPGADEIDPSPVLAVMTPLMFGYMFGDVGHGAVLMLVGWLARKRLPIMELLMVGGLSSMFFGFLFGSVFCIEHRLPPIWLTPLEHPLLILLIPIGFGWLMLLSGMLLGGVQARWQRALDRWWGYEAPVIAMYASVAVGLVSWNAALVLAALSLLWFLAASVVDGYRTGGSGGIFKNTAARVMGLLESVFQLAINTVSFARLGAFALAHSGLSAAVMALSAMPDNVVLRTLIFVLGNGIIIVLEGLVVSIQTTRLVMFEFFRRFFTGGGRLFHPLRLPQHRST